MTIEKNRITIFVILFLFLITPVLADTLSERAINGQFDQVTITEAEYIAQQDSRPPLPTGWNLVGDDSSMFWIPNDPSWDPGLGFHATVNIYSSGEHSGIMTTLNATGGQYVKIILDDGRNDDPVAVYLDNIELGTVEGANSSEQFDISNRPWSNASVLKALTNSNTELGTTTLIRSISLMARDTPPTPPPIVDFSGTPLTGTAPLDAVFTDNSTGSPDSYSWDFGDSSISTDKNPVHEYSAPGTYTVKHSATNAGGTGWNNKTAYVMVTGPYYVYAEVGDDGSEVYNMAEGFWNEITATSNWNAWKNPQGVDQVIIGPNDAREGHWRSSTKQGAANNWIERSDFAYFSGHGWPRQFSFKISDEISNVNFAHASNMSLGAGRLKWAMLDTCLSLN